MVLVAKNIRDPLRRDELQWSRRIPHINFLAIKRSISASPPNYRVEPVCHKVHAHEFDVLQCRRLRTHAEGVGAGTHHEVALGEAFVVIANIGLRGSLSRTFPYWRGDDEVRYDISNGTKVM